MAAQTKYAKSDGVSLAYQIHGDGDLDLIHIPGAMSNIALEAAVPAQARFIEGLSRFCRLIRFDKRGTGLSDVGSFPPTIEAQVPDVESIRIAAESERAAIYGLSQGAAVAIRYAIRYPERVSHMILVEGVCCDASDPEQPQSASNALTDWQALFDEADRDFAAFTQQLAELFFPGADTERLERFAMMLQATLSPSSFRALWQGVVGLDLREDLIDVSVPTLIIHARGDRHHPVAQSRYMAKHIPNARYLELDSESHLPNMEIDHVPEMLTAIEAFLTGTVQYTAERRVAAILFVDMVGSTRLQQSQGDAAWRETLQTYQANTERIVVQFGGRVVDTQGDGAMAEFSSPGDALRAAKDLVIAANQMDLQIRAGIHAGEVYEAEDRIVGICVNYAARVIAEAGPDEILASSVVQGLVEGSGFNFADRGEFDLKGIGKRRLYALEK